MSARRPNWGMWLTLGAVAGGVYWLMTKGAAVASQATNAVASGIANVYESLTFSAPMQAVGNVDDQAGNLLGPLSSFPFAMGSDGNGYLTINGMIYQMGPRDANGNFVAIPTGQPAPE